MPGWNVFACERMGAFGLTGDGTPAEWMGAYAIVLRSQSANAVHSQRSIVPVRQHR